MRDLSEHQFAEITIVYLDNHHNIVERTEQCLLVEPRELPSKTGLAYIPENSEENFAIYYRGVIEPNLFYVNNVRYLDDECDEYQEFITSLNHNRMLRNIDHLSSYVKTKFDQIIKNCPAEDYDSLIELLKISINS